MLAFLIDALAVFRLTRLVIEDEILREPRMVLIAKLEPDEGFTQPGDESKLAYFIQCPWCMSWWCGILVVCMRTFLPKVWHPLATVLALSAVTGLLAERENG